MTKLKSLITCLNCRFKQLKMLMWPKKWIIPTDLETCWVFSPRKLFKSGFFMKLHYFWFADSNLNAQIDLMKYDISLGSHEQFPQKNKKTWYNKRLIKTKPELYIQALTGGCAEKLLKQNWTKSEVFLPFAWLLFGTVKIPSKSKIRRGIPRAAWPITGRGPHALGCDHRAKKGQILTTKIGPFWHWTKRSVLSSVMYLRVGMSQ